MYRGYTLFPQWPSHGTSYAKTKIFDWGRGRGVLETKRSPYGAGKSFFIYLCLTSALSVNSPCLFAASPLSDARTHAAALFQSKCGSCHDSPDDSNGIFGPGWLPCTNVENGVCKDSKAEQQALMARVIKSVGWEAGVRKMPPPKNPNKPATSDYNKIRGQLDTSQINQLKAWAVAEAAPPPAPAGTAVASPPPEVDPVCQELSEWPKPDAGHPQVTDAEAAAIMGNSCAGCHGDLGTMTSREQQVSIGIGFAGLLAMAAIKGTQWVKDKLSPDGKREVTPIPQLSSLTPSLFQTCKYHMRRFLRNPFRLTAMGAAALTALWDPLESTCRHASLSIL